MADRSVIIEIDSNSKLGSKYIPNDPYTKTANAKMLARIIDNNALFVSNSSSKCKGSITRMRITRDRTEKSCIDMLLFSSDLQPCFESLVIDEKREHVLTKIGKSKKGIILKESDNHVLISKFNNKVAKDNKKSNVTCTT